ncbi:MAG TPA: IS110 family transposase [Candidatus Ratteibacteria bacterium]|nr:IS110 family transposase [Candidatus Paceibacterota bacterium]HRR96789.1 IS110 family transposase [Candidatus Ratteibacteria bacterium]
MIYVGIDWSDEDHKVYLTDDSEKRLDAFVILHTPEGVSELFARVEKFAKSVDDVLFAVEKPSGLLVSAILDRGFTLYPINPKAVDRYRDRFKVSGKKDDFFDARVLANILRTDRHIHKPLIPDSPVCRNLKILTRQYESLSRLKRRVMNQIISTLKDYYPVALELFGKIDQPITIDFLKRFPTAEKFSKLTISQIKNFLKKHHYPGVEKKADELFQLAKTPHFQVEEFVVESRSLYLSTLLTQLKNLMNALTTFEHEIEKILSQHPDKDIFLSLPGSGNLTSAKLIAEFGDDRDRYKKVGAVQAVAGSCPVTRQSGKYRNVYFRKACIKPFRNATNQFAFNSIKNSQWAKDRYKKYVDSGKKKTHALRCLSNAWLEVIFAMWKNRSTYDEQKHLKIVKEQFQGEISPSFLTC